ncbi:MAG TPA: 3-hydroxyacyl-CoA dehydrogenase family protein [Bryobacteraceae bacterium]|nr:3-hydroxyacyl-CoA dehydrogenase family protein [Bryobacteraceae bacterium]
MPEISNGTIAVVGAGFMGTVIATLYAHYGYKVILTDLMPKPLEAYRTRAEPIARSLVGANKKMDVIFANVVTEINLEKAVKDAFFVHEVIHEEINAKQSLFERLDRICPREVVLGTNTSSLKLSDICANVANRDRVIGVHYITPAHIIKLVELIVADFTPKELIDWSKKFLKTIDHVGVVCTDTPGFLVNRLQYALLSEAYRIVEEGAASRDDVDTAMKLSLGPRLALWGPLLTEDLVVSKKTSADIWDYLYRKTNLEKFQCPPGITRFVEQNRLGAISGAGWYDFARDYASVVTARDSQLKSILDWLEKNDRVEEFKVS